jgi:hypothetical protein
LSGCYRSDKRPDGVSNIAADRGYSQEYAVSKAYATREGAHFATKTTNSWAIDSSNASALSTFATVKVQKGICV